MKKVFYKLYYINYKYIMSDYVDEDGFVDNYYADWIEEEVVLAYCETKDAVNRWLDLFEESYKNEEIQMEELELFV